MKIRLPNHCRKKIKSILVYLATVIIPGSTVLTAAAQSNSSTRFRDPVFEKVSIKRNINYQSVVKEGIKKKYYLLDLYEPEGDTLELRPLIINLHGGGFKLGNKKSTCTPSFSRSYAQRGYVCAAINYRLSRKKPLSKFKDLAEGCFDAIEDMNSAIAFLVAHSREYRIDTNRIILAGNSAGAITVVQAVYSNPALRAKFIPGITRPTDSTALTPRYTAVVNLWGAVFDTGWIQYSSIPIVSIHGTRDRIVPYDHKDSNMFGSLSIHRQASQFKIPNSYKAFEGFGHELHKHFNPFWAGRPTKKRWKKAAQFISEFLYREVIIPSPTRRVAPDG
jgi:predicted esterase